MTDWLLGLVPLYGPMLLAIGTFTSCLALPIPASILMLAAGGFVASGDLSMMSTYLAALAGAIAGDQLGYLGGRVGGARFLARLGTHAAPVAKATELLARHGGGAIFFSRWLVSALGPYVNVAAGAALLPWSVFTVWGVAGEAVWVSLYIGAGYAFTGNLAEASSMVVNILGMLAAGAVAVALGAWLLAMAKSDQSRADRA